MNNLKLTCTFTIVSILYKIIVQLVFALFSIAAISQTNERVRVNLFNNSNGLSKQIIKGIAEDKNGFIWLLSDHQLQWFDGSSFHQVPFGTGIHQLPGSLYNDIYQGVEKDIWIFYNNGYSIYDPKTFTFKHYPFPGNKINLETRVFITPSNKEIILFKNGEFQIINTVTKKKVKVVNSRSNALGVASTNNDNQWAFFTEDETGRMIEDIDNKKRIPLPNPEKIEYFIYKRLSDSIIVYFSEKHFLAYNINSKTIVKKSSYPFGYSMKAFIKNKDIINKDNKSLLIIMENEIWEFNKQTLNFNNKLVGLNGSGTLNQGYYNSIFIDSKGILWASTTLNGLHKIVFQKHPIKLYASPNESENFIKCFFPDKKNNTIICGTFGSGLIIYDTIGNILKRYPLKTKDAKTGTIVSAIIELSDLKCLVMLYGRSDFYLFDRKNLTLKQTKIIYKNKDIEKEKPNYYSIPFSVNNKEYFYDLGALKLSIKYTKGKVIFEKRKTKISKYAINQYPIYTKYTSQVELSGSAFIQKCLQNIGLVETSLVYIDKRKDNWILGTSYGLYEFTSQSSLLKSYTTKNGLANDYIYAGVIDNQNNIWCSHDKGISKIDSNGVILNFSKLDGLQEDEFNYGAIAKTSDGELYFGGINGLNAFYPDQLNSSEEKTHLLITRISSNEENIPEDTAFWNLDTLQFKHSNNRIKIQVSAIGNNVAQGYNFQYRLIGLDKEWKNLKNSKEINLALTPGIYIVEIASGRFFNKKAKSQKQIYIKVLPPIYLTWWFLSMAGIILVGSIWYTAKYLTARKYQQKIQAIKMQEQLEFERQRISRDLHDNMGAYTSALMANVDKLKYMQGNNNELNKIQDNAEHIMNSLRETIWVLNNKEINIADFSDEFKTYCFNVLKNFEDFEFESFENIKNDCTLNASDAININKILQEVIQNIIKHSKANKIIFNLNCESILVITIKDNGIGFETDKKYVGNGLENIEWRAREAGLQVEIISNKNKGTKITLTKNMLSKEY